MTRVATRTVNSAINPRASWHEALAKLEKSHSPYVLVTLLGVQGSTPRDSGTKMVISVRQDKVEIWGTIGGGHLEYKVMSMAAELLAAGKADQRLEHFPLGAGLGQCCGGRASVLLECFPGTDLTIALFGAGHVGRSLATILSGLPCRFYWVDSRDSEFPDVLPGNAIKRVSDQPEDEVSAMPQGAYYVVMTHQHSLDYAITEKAINKGDARYIGLIASKTKWQRFQMRFQHRGYGESRYQSVHCPIGLSTVPGKHPMEVAVSVAAEIIAEYQSDKPCTPVRQGISWADLTSINQPVGTKPLGQSILEKYENE